MLGSAGTLSSDSLRSLWELCQCRRRRASLHSWERPHWNAALEQIALPADLRLSIQNDSHESVADLRRTSMPGASYSYLNSVLTPYHCVNGAMVDIKGSTDPVRTATLKDCR